MHWTRRCGVVGVLSLALVATGNAQTYSQSFTMTVGETENDNEVSRGYRKGTVAGFDTSYNFDLVGGEFGSLEPVAFTISGTRYRIVFLEYTDTTTSRMRMEINPILPDATPMFLTVDGRDYGSVWDSPLQRVLTGSGFYWYFSDGSGPDWMTGESVRVTLSSAPLDGVSTPALPFFGAVALAGALVVASRRRMRQLRARREPRLIP